MENRGVQATARLATPIPSEALQRTKLGNRIELVTSYPFPAFAMRDAIPDLLRSKEDALATLDKRTSERRSTLERELATLDEWAEQERERLREDLQSLQRAAQIEEETFLSSRAPTKGYTKKEREELFAVRTNVLRQMLEISPNAEVDSKHLAEALGRPVTTVKDYFNEQLELRPGQCFWQNGTDKAHFRWKDGYRPQHGPASPPPDAGVAP